MSLSPYLRFRRDEWAALRADTPLTLADRDLDRIHGLVERMSLREIEEIYLPLSRLLNLHVAAVQGLYRATATFLGHGEEKVPFLIGLGGSVAVGKSTAARALRELLARWPHHPRVDLVTTDGFLWPTAVLEERGLLQRKGFPESYDVRALLGFVRDLKAGKDRVASPVYSHVLYDILPGESIVVEQPDIVIVEGLNVLHSGLAGEGAPRVFVSDYFDFTIYVDAAAADIRSWYVERFLAFRTTAFRDPSSYFHRYAGLSDAEAEETADRIWAEINEPNLLANILPTRERADLVLRKGRDHAVEEVWLRKL
ncbi:MAG TPA: type I pantothenate kinase [Vicinamibacteria bacterium]|nr:type I pantothenate kinase [Vicinamibacteria bacterium]